MSTVEAAIERASQYIAEVMTAATLGELRALWTEAVRAGLGERATFLVLRAIEARKAALEDRDEAAMTLLARELGARLIEPLPDRVVLVTGAREWPAEHCGVIGDALMGALVSDDRENPSDPLLIHGGARGADSYAHEFWCALGEVRDPEVYPVTDADWAAHGRSAGHRRNRIMVDRAVSLHRQGVPVEVLAFPYGRSAGTRGCMAAAEHAGLTVISFARAVPAFGVA